MEWINVLVNGINGFNPFVSFLGDHLPRTTCTPKMR